MTSPITAFNKAIAAYTEAWRTESPQAPQPAGTAGPSFAGLVKDALADATAAAKGSEAATTAAMTTGADMSNVVTAVAEAEAALQTVVAVRDRVIEAYKDIMRMPI